MWWHSLNLHSLCPIRKLAPANHVFQSRHSASSASSPTSPLWTSASPRQYHVLMMGQSPGWHGLQSILGANIKERVPCYASVTTNTVADWERHDIRSGFSFPCPRIEESHTSHMLLTTNQLATKFISCGQHYVLQWGRDEAVSVIYPPSDNSSRVMFLDSIWMVSYLVVTFQ